MYVLGIGPGLKIGHHDSSAALLKDGKLIAACEEERFTGQKKARALFPRNAIEYCLEEAGITIDVVDTVASPLVTYDNYVERIRLLFEFHFGNSPKVDLHHHHLCHAASAYYLSGFKDSLVLSIDYSGDSASGLIARGLSERIEVEKYFARDDSIGFFYSMITQFLGFEAHSDEYKVMGLASYGKPRYLDKMKQILDVENGEPRLNLSFNQRRAHPEIYTTDFTTFQERSYTKELIELLGPPRTNREEITQRHKDIASSLQKQFEDVVFGILAAAGPSKNLCFAGGAALNCKLNQEIVKAGWYEGFFVQPAAGDAGVALGAALLSGVAFGTKEFDTNNIVYLGPSYNDEQVKRQLDLCKLEYRVLENPEKTAAELIAQDKIVGWFQGRSEWGPRALGNRSILANPANISMKDAVNKNVKFREEFRPFAPAVLKEHQDRYFRNCVDDPFMVTLADATRHAQSTIPAVVHADGTARLQTVTRCANESFWRLINHLGELTGNYVVLNTSLNLNGQPLASKISEALKTYHASGMDCLIIGSFLLEKRR